MEYKGVSAVICSLGFILGSTPILYQMLFNLIPRYYVVIYWATLSIKFGYDYNYFYFRAGLIVMWLCAMMSYKIHIRRLRSKLMNRAMKIDYIQGAGKDLYRRRNYLIKTDLPKKPWESNIHFLREDLVGLGELIAKVSKVTKYGIENECEISKEVFPSLSTLINDYQDITDLYKRRVDNSKKMIIL